MDDIKATALITERQILRDQRIVVLAKEFEIGDGSSMETDFITDMILLSNDGSKEPITIILASNGGEVDAGNACIRAIRIVQSKGIKVIGQVHGHCMSMAFFLLQTCDERIMGSGDILMIHGISTYLRGDMKNIEAEKKLLEWFQKYFSKLIATRSSKVNPKLNENYWAKRLMSNVPSFYNSEESLKMGLIDKVED
jgi:ATP-dependent protease ClpP protease subunit